MPVSLLKEVFGTHVKVRIALRRFMSGCPFAVLFFVRLMLLLLLLLLLHSVPPFWSLPKENVDVESYADAVARFSIGTALRGRKFQVRGESPPYYQHALAPGITICLPNEIVACSTMLSWLA